MGGGEAFPVESLQETMDHNETDSAGAELIIDLRDCQANRPLTVIGEVEGVMADSEEGVYTCTSLTYGRREEDPLPEIVLDNITLQPETMQLGAGNSHHEVVFGAAETVVNGEVSEVEVALKAFNLDSGAALHELMSTVKVAARGLATFKPLAIARVSDKAVYITETMNYLTGYDSYNWTLDPKDSNYEDYMSTMLGSCAEAMTDMASRGIYHGDIVPKNIVVNEKNEFVFFDFEDTEVLEDLSEINDWLTGYGSHENSPAMVDLTHFWNYVISPYETPTPFLQDEDSESVLHEFESKLLAPYIESLQRKLHEIHGEDTAQGFDAETFTSTASRIIAKKLGIRI